ncbi:HutD/Ves family protein [Microvirga sp. 2MCAF38]|uniref:HutD/Ves family protein n=1 Tax=Microvirga sp. 2MCAF38 TaxID=3232989 RepID=UPI003F9A7E28
MPWKNSGGTTFEIATGPEGAGLDDFDWRISMALVATPGPFSLFPGCDRTLCVLTDGPLSLRVGRSPLLLLDEETEPFTFPADVPAAAEGIGSPLLDLNVMCRRGRARAQVSRHRGAALILEPTSGTLAVLSKGGDAEIFGTSDTLNDGDVLLMQGCESQIRIHPDMRATLYRVQIDAVQTAGA